MQKVKIQLRETLKMKATIEKKMKRGKESWGFIYITYGVSLAIVSFLLGLFLLAGGINLLFLLELCLF
jgi:thiol:disulfide interchange protein